MKKLLYLSLAAGLLTGCVKEIEIDYPGSQKLLTLNSLIEPTDTATALLSVTIPFQQSGYSPYLKDADLHLYENGIMVEAMSICSVGFSSESEDSIWRYCMHHNFKAGATYKITAHKEGFPEIYAQTRMPQKVPITRVKEMPDEDYGLPVEVSISDPKEEDNYYILEFIRQPHEFSRPNQIVMRSSDPTVELYAYYGLISIPLDDQKGHRAYFTDQYFNGQTKSIQLRLETHTFISNQDHEPYSYAKLHSVSKEYYEYAKSLDINRAVGENPFSEPLRVSSNVENGFGILGARQIFKWQR